MTLYFDSSAIVKLVVDEPESDALRRFIASSGHDSLASSAIAGVEVRRAAVVNSEATAARARLHLLRFEQIAVDNTVLERAAAIAPGSGLRSLDAIHVASAELLRDELTAIVTYDQRMVAAAELVGLPVVSPA